MDLYPIAQTLGAHVWTKALSEALEKSLQLLPEPAAIESLEYLKGSQCQTEGL